MQKIITPCRFATAPFVLGLCITNPQGESHADDCGETAGLENPRFGWVAFSAVL
jgi:hypothetical protein